MPSPERLGHRFDRPVRSVEPRAETDEAVDLPGHPLDVGGDARAPHRGRERLALVPEQVAAGRHHQRWRQPAAVASGAATLGLGGLDDAGARPLWWRLASAVLPVLVVALGLAAISLWHEFDAADEMADVDLVLLTDDVPISAYADRGFGVFLKYNSRQ